jgi:cytoskeletal protein CcmA (bactofilin family)
MMIGKKQAPLETLIGQDSLIKGEVISKGVVRIDGVIEGNVQADFLMVSKTGAVRGDMFVREVEIDGTVEGNINAQELIEIRPEGAVEGDVRTVKLIISEGAFFSGHSYMQKPGVSEQESETADEKKIEKNLLKYAKS